MSTDSPPASYGEVEVQINARDAASALRLAISAACNLFFTHRLPITDDEVDELHREALGGDFGAKPEADDPRAATWAPGGGAWTACVGRLSYPDLNGSEKTADYGVASLTLLGPRPHTFPHATDDATYWHAVARALDEHEALNQSAPPVMPTEPGRAPRL